MIEPEDILMKYTQTLQKHLNADIIAMDILEEEDGNRFNVEYKDIPGLSGFPEDVKTELAERVKQLLG